MDERSSRPDFAARATSGLGAARRQGGVGVFYFSQHALAALVVFAPLVALLGQLQPDEEAGKHQERDNDERGDHDQQKRRHYLYDSHRLPP